MNWNWPQIIVIGLMAVNVIVGVCLNGTPRKPLDGASLIVCTALWALLLGWGGFWK